MKIPLILLLALVGFCSASAQSETITESAFAHADDINEFQEKKTAKLLKYMREELEFISGKKIGLISNQKFGGTSVAVGGFLELLYQASADPISVEFQDFGKNNKLAFILQQFSTTNSVIVNLNRDDFRLRDFRAFLPGSQSNQWKTDKSLQFLRSLKLQPEKKPDALVQIGRRLAEKDLGDGILRVFYYGKPWSSGKAFIDDASGLKVTLAAGCVVGGDFVGIVHAYNARMREASTGKR